MKKEWVLDGLDCANCAAGIEREVAGLGGVRSASVDFVTATLRVETDGSMHPGEMKESIQKIARRHDAGILLKEKKEGVRPKKHDHGQCGDGQCGLADVYADEHGEEGDEHGHSHDGPVEWKEYAPLLIGVVFFAAGLLIRFPQPWEFLVFFAAYLLIGGEVVWQALKNIRHGKIFDENFLMSVATVGAFAIGSYAEGVSVMLFYQVGEFFQDLAVNRSRRAITSLMDIRPDYANVKTGGEVKRVSPEDVTVGDIIQVKAGEKIPLDGKVIEGVASLDTSALTGESLPRTAKAGDEVLSGSVDIDGLLEVEVTKAFGESTVSKILDLVQNASGKKAQTENFITKFARYYTPAVVFAALALAVIPPLVTGDPFSMWIYRALIFLVVSCPCALVISIPLSFFGGIGGASRNGVLVKGGNYLEALANAEIVVMDKTGTLTKGVFNVTRLLPAEGFSDERLLELAAHAEAYSNHPIAQSVRRAYGRDVDESRVSEPKEIAGKGIDIHVDGKPVLAGNARLMQSVGLTVPKQEPDGTVVYLAQDGRYAGALVISDEVKPDSRAAVSGMKQAGVRTVAMLTGDHVSAAEKVGREVGVDKVCADLLPQQKVEQVEELYRELSPKGKLVFVGDGINDAPVLARADVGIAMGGVGSDAAIEAADVVLMTDEPSKIVDAIDIAKLTRRIVWENIGFALGVKLVIMVLGALGVATMWEAVFGDVGVALIAILNATRVLRYHARKPAGNG